MESVLSGKMLAVLGLVLLVSGLNEGRTVSTCELKAGLEAAHFQVMPGNMSLEELVTKLVCKASNSDFNTNFVKLVTDNHEDHIPGHGPDHAPPQFPAPSQFPPRAPPQVPSGAPPQVPPRAPFQVPSGAPPQVPPRAPFQVPSGAPPQVPPRAPFQVPSGAPPQFLPRAPPQVPSGSPPQVPPRAPFQGPQGHRGPQVPGQAPSQVPAQGPQGPPVPPNKDKTNASPKKPKRSISEGRDSQDAIDWHKYGIFQLSEKLACDSGIVPSLNVCQMNCTALVDDDITDDITCLQTLINSVKPKTTEQLSDTPPHMMYRLEELMVKECRNAEPSQYFSNCV